MTTASFGAVRTLIGTIRDDLRERREARAAYRVLEHELASYRTQREVDDLLGAIEGQSDPEAEQIRGLLLDNLRPTDALYRAA